MDMDTPLYYEMIDTKGFQNWRSKVLSAIWDATGFDNSDEQVNNLKDYFYEQWGDEIDERFYTALLEFIKEKGGERPEFIDEYTRQIEPEIDEAWVFEMVQNLRRYRFTRSLRRQYTKPLTPEQEPNPKRRRVSWRACPVSAFPKAPPTPRQEPDEKCRREWYKYSPIDWLVKNMPTPKTEPDSECRRLSVLRTRRVALPKERLNPELEPDLNVRMVWYRYAPIDQLTHLTVEEEPDEACRKEVEWRLIGEDWRFV